jgi:subtilisin family serine protease
MKRYIVILVFLVLPAATFASAPLGKMLTKAYPLMTQGEHLPVMIYFTDKEPFSKGRSIQGARALLSNRAIRRRLKMRPAENLLDESDYPMKREYIDEAGKHITKMRQELKWFNAISAEATKEQIAELQDLPFVKTIELVGRYKRSQPPAPTHLSKNAAPLRKPLAAGLNYGPSFTQVNQIDVPALQNMGYYGQGVVIGMFDDGWRLLSHETFDSMTIIATYDFVDHKVSVVPNYVGKVDFGGHGINTLSVIGGYTPGELIGPAFKADFILARTENDSSETPIEEDNWVSGIMWMDSIGVDVTSTSLGYLTFDPPYPSLTWEDMDGRTAIISIAAAHAVSLGIVVVNSAGNDAEDGTPNTLVAPADADSIITVGAVDYTGTITFFSSYGPTVDGRTKPDVVAMGIGVTYAYEYNDTEFASIEWGTSFSCPLVAGAAALVLSINPSWNPIMVRDALRQTASQANTPDDYYGWGIIDALAAAYYYYPVQGGWNLLSLPKQVADNHFADIYPTAISQGYYYNHGYQPTDTLGVGNGYWVKFDSSQWIGMAGTLQGSDTVYVQKGWNIIGTPSFPVAAGDIVQFPDSIVGGGTGYYGYSGKYTLVDTLRPHTGYWVKAKGSGVLILISQP